MIAFYCDDELLQETGDNIVNYCLFSYDSYDVSKRPRSGKPTHMEGIDETPRKGLKS